MRNGVPSVWSLSFVLMAACGGGEARLDTLRVGVIPDREGAICLA
jgi:hypothetical protein